MFTPRLLCPIMCICCLRRWLNEHKQEVYSLAELIGAIKGASSHEINRKLGRSGNVWQEESFDHVLRRSEALDEKIVYMLDNPVRAGIVSSAKGI